MQAADGRGRADRSDPARQRSIARAEVRVDPREVGLRGDPRVREPSLLPELGAPLDRGHRPAELAQIELDPVREHQRVRLAPFVADLGGDRGRLAGGRRRALVIAGEELHEAGQGQVLSEHRTVVELAPQAASLPQAVGRGREIPDRHVAAAHVVQRKGDLLALAELARERQRRLPGRDRADRVAAAIDVRDRHVPEGARLGRPVAEPPGHRRVLLGEHPASLGVEQRRGRREQQRHRAVGRQLHRPVAATQATSRISS